MQVRALIGMGIACVALLASSACATMAHGVRQNVIIKSDPPGAQVFLDGEAIGVTPFVADFWRGRSGIVLRFEMPGYEPQDLPLNRDPSAMIAVDVAVGLNPMKMQGMDHADAGTYIGSSLAALGMTLGPDLLTGGAYKFQNVVTATLKRKP